MSKRILIIESGIPVIPFEETLLLRKEHEVFRAVSEEQVLEQLEKQSFDLIILDENLQERPVEGLISKIRSSPNGKELSIIQFASEEKPLPKGVNRILTKPVISAEFNETCRKLLQVESRRESRLLVYVQVQGFAQSNFFLCNSRNLSASGILIMTTKRLKMGDSVQLQITLPREKEKVKAFAKVVREAPEVTSQLNVYGLHFVEISEKDRERIRNFIKETKEEN